MNKFFSAFLLANSKRRNVAVASALWILSHVREACEHEMHRCEDMLDNLAKEKNNSIFLGEYNLLMDQYAECEDAFYILEQTIDELSLEYRIER